MKIEKEIVSKLPREYLFVSGILDLDAKYFKRRIDEGVKASTINYQTNVYGRHTEWEFFNKDKEFNILLFQMIDYLETLTMDLQRFYLRNAWGLIEGLGEYTQKHHHEPNYISGAIYINDHPQKLYFPEIKQEILPTKGKFVMFSSFLNHHTKRNIVDKEKYGISFNFRSAMVLEK
jgi:hypothetical protein|tara:strand:- start:4430 stop:4957 length:528 start_codon:yes stop_codon:yes gene_type:complete